MNIRDLAVIDRFFPCAPGSGQLVDPAWLAAAGGVDQRTALQWPSALDASHVLFRLPASEPSFRERPVQTPKPFWRDASASTPADEPAPERDELCRVSLSELETYRKRVRGEGGVVRYRDALDGGWFPLDRRARPGETLLLDAAHGGYDPRFGFVASSRKRVEPIVREEEPAQPAEDYDADWRRRQVHPVALERHLLDVEDEARALCDALGVGAERAAIERAARWHDVNLVAARHGTLRLGLRARPGEIAPDDPARRFARGAWDGDRVPGLQIGDRETVGEAVLHLDVAELGGGAAGRSWAERTQGLVARYGPFGLAGMETLVRVPDWRASAREQALGDEGVDLRRPGQADAA